MPNFFERLLELLSGKHNKPVEPLAPTPEPTPFVPPVVVVAAPVIQSSPIAEPTKAQRLAACIAAACIVAAPIATKWEGFSAKVYLDPAKIPTYCYGETERVDPAKIYTKGQCSDLLRARMAKDYAPRIAQCLPGIVDNRFIFGALLDASYNAGWAGVCKSRMAVSFKAGQLRAGCNGFAGWYVTARNRKTGAVVRYTGLVNRRLDERAVCLKGVA